jgi:hypothetical protein
VTSVGALCFRFVRDLWLAYGSQLIFLLIGALIGWFGNWFFYWRAEKPKLLGWEVMSKSRIISEWSNRRPNLKLVYEDQEVANPNIVVLRLGTVGKKSIPASDVSEPIKITLKNTKLLAAEIVDSSNPDVKARLSVSADDPNVVEVEPQLFLKDEWLEVRLITDGALSDPVVHARVVDGEVVEVLSKDDSAEMAKSNAIFISMTATIIVGGEFLFGPSAPPTTWPI